MWARVVCLIGIVCGFVSCGWAQDYLATTTYGELLPGSSEQVGLWWASSGWKVGQDRALPKAKGRRDPHSGGEERGRGGPVGGAARGGLEGTCP